MVNNEVRATFDAMDELITGLAGIASGTQELMSATALMMDIANEASRDVVDRVVSGSESVSALSRFSCDLEGKMDRVRKELIAIEEVLNRIQRIGERNIEQIAVFEKDLEAIQACVIR